MDKEIALIQSRAFWSALFALIAIVAQTFGWAQALSFASDPHTVDAVMTVVTAIFAFAAVIFARIPQGKIVSVLPPSSPSSAPPKSGGTAAAIVAALLVLPLIPGCVTLGQVAAVTGALTKLSISQGQIDALRTAYDGAVLTPAAAYRQLGYCAPGASWTLARPCADRALVVKLRTVDANFVQALGVAQNLVTSGNNKGLAAAYALAQQALTSAEAIAATLPTATSSAAHS